MGTEDSTQAGELHSGNGSNGNTVAVDPARLADLSSRLDRLYSLQHQLAQAVQPSHLTGLQSPLISRSEFAATHNLPFEGKRDLNRILGYQQLLLPHNYRERYERDGIAKRIVECFPLATWGNRFAVVENPNPKTTTRFERQLLALYDRLNVWEVFLRADILCQLGSYSVIYLDVADENPESKLPRATSQDDLWNLIPLSEEYATIDAWDDNVRSRRYGKPEFYKLALGLNTNGVNPRKVHWSRVIHIAEGCLTNDLFGVPILRPVWNLLDDLNKVVGGGAESAWLQMSPGLTAKVDPEIAKKVPNFTSKLEEMEEEIENFEHGLTRFMKLVGVDVQRLQSSAPNFAGNAHTIMQLIAGTIAYPFRMLFGSEMGELASSQDRSNANDRIAERYMRFGDAVVRNFNQRLFEYGYLTPPASRNGYEIIWPVEEEMTEDEKAGVCEKFARANQAQSNAGGGLIRTSDEIRDLVLGQEPLEQQNTQNNDPEDSGDDTTENDRNDVQSLQKNLQYARNSTHYRRPRIGVVSHVNSLQVLREAKLRLQEGLSQ